MYRILLTFLAIFLVSSVSGQDSDNKTQLKIKEICKQTADIKFCTSLFANVKSPSTSDKELVNVTVRQSDRFAGNTYFYIGTLLRNAGDERPGLQMCAEAYAGIQIAFMRTVAYFENGEYSKFPELEEMVNDSLPICKTNFTVPGFKINPLIEKGRKIMILVNLVKIVTHLLSL